RPEPDPQLVRGLWTLLPHGSRRELWPATFAFGNALGFDALVVPRRGDDDYAGYTSEEQAADYPAGQYELALQTAAESGDQRTLNELFGRRGSRETLRLAILMALVLSLVVLLLRWFPVPEPAPPPPPPPVVWAPELRERAAAGAAAAGSGDPWAAVGWIEFTKYRRGERAATAAGIVAAGDPWTAAVQARAADSRSVERWQPAPGE